MREQIYNINVVAKEKLPSPKALKSTLPLTKVARKTVLDSRSNLMSILDGKDKRLVVVVGPCSIHDTDLALDYAHRLKALAAQVEDQFLILMRVYFEKPRTTTGWKGLINDPNIDDSFQIDKGVHIARSLLIKLNEMGLGVATEALDPIMPQYLGDITSWTAIGARTAESQTHREMASGLSTPVGFKNGTDGSLSVAINAIKSSRQSHHFLGLNEKGRVTVYETKGNKYTHVVLRGGVKPNYDIKSIRACEKQLTQEKLPGADGSLSVAINAIKSSRQSHHFLGLNEKGRVTVYETKGNKYTHVVLRGGVKPNYHIKSIRACEQQLANEKLPQRIMIDCSHGNTNKDYTLQPKVAQYCIDQVIKGNDSIIGIMLESNIHEGNQKITNDLKYGVSLTDACINWETTEKLLLKLAKRLRAK